MEAPKTTYSIRQVSDRTGLKSHVLRYYEQEGLLPCVGRTQSGIRRYTDDDLELLGLICCLKNTGMSIKQIREFVELSEKGNKTLKKRCEKLIEHKQSVEIQIQEMQKHLEKVSHKIQFFTNQYDEYCKNNPDIPKQNNRKTSVSPSDIEF